MKKLNWKKVWEEFDKWCEDERAKTEYCDCCGARGDCKSDDWENQQLAIQRIITRMLR